jgi:hypothetical protein
MLAEVLHQICLYWIASTMVYCSFCLTLSTSLVWSGLVWSGLVWCCVVWCGLVWCGVVWSGVVWSAVVWSGVVLCGLVWSGLVGCNMPALLVVFTAFPPRYNKLIV